MSGETDLLSTGLGEAIGPHRDEQLRIIAITAPQRARPYSCAPLNFPIAPLILGFILGGMIEDNLRRALAISDGSFSFIWSRPLTLSIFSVAILAMLVPALRTLRARRQTRGLGDGEQPRAKQPVQRPVLRASDSDCHLS